MPRCVRIVDLNGIYHVMVRSISEIKLFKNKEDKEKYLKLFKKYQDIFLFKIYAFCIMNNHAHFIIDCNGANISKFMHHINQSYAQYYNKKHNRHGHVFADRFKSLLIQDDCYLKNVSAYIHNNPKDINGYKNKVEKYKYSSISNYMGKINDCFVIVDTNFILEQFNTDFNKSRQLYYNFVKKNYNQTLPNAELTEQPSEYKSNRTPLIRNFSTKEVINYVANRLNFPVNEINIKFSHKSTNFRAICIVLLHSLCDLNNKDLCILLGNISSSQISKLGTKGYNLIHENDEYSDILPDFIKKFRVA